MTDSSDENKIPGDRAAIARDMTAFWADALVSVLQSMTGDRPKIELRASTATGSEEGFAWWGQRQSILEQPSFWIGAPAESWTALGRMVLSALGVDDPAESDIEATCRDVMAQTSAMVAGELTRKFGEAITGSDSISGSQPGAGGVPALRWSLDAGLVSIEGAAVWADAFFQHCSSLSPAPAAEEEARQEVSAETGGETPQFGGRPVDSIPRFDLRVKFVLGRTSLPLRDVFKLNVGSVVELDRTAIEPADVLIHDRVVARAQVVVVNGYYAMKILPHRQ